MDRVIKKDKLMMRIRKLTTHVGQAMDLVDAYLSLGPNQSVKILKELLSEEQWLANNDKNESSKKLDEISIASVDLMKVMGE